MRGSQEANLVPHHCCRCCKLPRRCCSECITLSKRLLVEGEGQLRETVIDQRANCPTFRIVR